ncbi:class II aldolase/adducin family protein [Arenibaculum sp.]|uniref:class II aldolase/adducin family protein n=1 Tax=Arenibaculum sp. TaxID=2865862 RepID=UPI002E149205|nr:class II aldolase/adducin family protein [Arenibaculum sp.]
MTTVPRSEWPDDALEKLAVASRILEMEGHGDMTLGHLSLRDPMGRGFWLKRNAFGLGEILGPADFVLLGFDGVQIAGEGGRHSEWPIHSEILRARPDVTVVAHTHPFHTCLFSASDDPLLPYTLDADYFAELPKHAGTAALVNTVELGADLARALGPTAHAVLMANHGATFCGTSVEHAAIVGVFLERACRAHMAGKAAGLRCSFPDPSERTLRHRQIMQPVHVSHSWNYFTRKLADRSRDGEPRALYAS